MKTNKVIQVKGKISEESLSRLLALGYVVIFR